MLAFEAQISFKCIMAVVKAGVDDLRIPATRLCTNTSMPLNDYRRRAITSSKLSSDRQTYGAGTDDLLSCQ